ncbi:MAG TPA: FxsA family protein [Thermoleophilaceae bacterium]|nr:FxsA family protein [Thermoleophilaceae bacterium]
MPLLLIAVFIVVPIAELYVILQVGDAIGALPTIALLVADSLLGSMLLRSQGRSVWRQFNEAMRAGRMPHRELFDGIAVIFGGAFLITPGFLTDVVGLLLLIPPTRAVLRRFAVRRLGKRFGLGAVAGVAGRARRPRRPEDTVEGTAREHRDEPPQGRIGP